MVKAIYDIEPYCDVYPEMGVCQVLLTYKGKAYMGLAELSPEDKDFFSEKVGLNIALSRARIKILKDLLKEVELISNTRYQMYQEACRYGKIPPAQVDPTGTFLNKSIKALNNYKKVRQALKKEKTYLQNYLQQQTIMVESIKRQRAKGKKE